MCPPMIAHWRHLANITELVHPSTHSSPQPKWQMDRFSRFCTAYGRKCLYFTMGAPIHQNCPFPWGIWTSHVARCFGPMRAHNPNSTSIGLAVFAQMTAKCPYIGLPVCPSNLFLAMLVSGSLGPIGSGTQTVTWSFQPFLQGSLV